MPIVNKTFLMDIGYFKFTDTRSKIGDEKVDRRVWKSNLTPREKFKKAIRQVRMICAVNINLNKYANEAGHSTFAAHMPELLGTASKQHVVVSSPDTNETISFNRKNFKFNYEFKWPKKAESLLEKDPEDRTPADIAVIRGLMCGLHSFRKYTRVSQNLICKVVRLERYNRRRVVVRKGHLGYAFYFVFSGAAGVTLDIDEGTAFIKKEVTVLKKGACFGEIALLKDVRRTATVVCMEETELLAVDRDQFYCNGLHLHFEKEFKYRYEFFRKLDLFSTWSDEKLQEISDMGRIEEYNHDAVVVKDLRDIGWLLFVTKGKCDVLKLVDVAKCVTTPIDNDSRSKSMPIRSPTPVSYGGDVPLSLLSKSDVIPDPGGRGWPGPYSSTSPWITHSSMPANRPKTTGQLALKNGKESELQESRPRSATVRFETSSVVESTISEFDNRSLSNSLPKSTGIRRSSYSGVSTSSSPKTYGVQTFKTEDVEAGVYIKIDELRSGQCFGIEGVTGSMSHLSLVSCGSEIVRVSLSKFKEYADEETLAKVEEMIATYPSDSYLWSRFVKQSKWNIFKNNMIADIFREKKTNTKRRTSINRSLSRSSDSDQIQFVQNAFPRINFSAQAWADNVVPRANVKNRQTPTYRPRSRKNRQGLSPHNSMKDASSVEEQLSSSSVASSTPRKPKATRLHGSTVSPLTSRYAR
ncbi:cyclic nucleotide-binding domain-containing protein 2-like isoform X2 [Anneissia japonica]|uniref:cyclic nucleotide-binding domain-containing protein 2-like isoform X2 n=1 Tax=Anneissia japonica TaxID=1529436 RepID=UPI00142557AF|nr:cyclic nucleotide-binding domain-containing protein 2-like isoform X2 [Anneissia japonica]